MTSSIFVRRFNPRRGTSTGDNSSTRRADPVRCAAQQACEPLEQRMLLSTIQWTNKGSPGVDSDNFNFTYGANATVARSIVQRAIDDWERVIVDFNYAGGGNTFNVNISAGPINGRGVTNNGTADVLGKMTSAVITLDDNGGGAGWYFDSVIGSATVPDDGEFTNLSSPFEAAFTGVGGAANDDDMYRTAAHELGHAMGIFVGAGGILSGVPAILAFQTDTNIDDPLDNQTAATLVNFNVGGGAVEATLTENGGGHFYEGAPQGGGTISHPNDLLNAGRTVNAPPTIRQLISNLDASILQLAYGYTIQLPGTINTFYANLNTTTNVVTVNGDADPFGNDADVIDLEVSGTAMRFEVNNSSETIEGAQFATIVVEAGLDDDDIDVDALLSGKSVTVNGESGNDSVDVSLEGGDVDSTVLSNFTFNGGSGTDALRLHDTADGVNSDTYEFTSSVASKAARDITHSTIESITVNGSPQASTYNINSLSSTLTGGLTINAGDANDTITLGGTTGDIDSNIFAGVQVHGNGGSDTMHFNDASDDNTVDDSYTLTSFGFDKSSTSEVWGFDTIEDVVMTAGLADNPISVISMSQTLAPTLQTLVVNGNNGNDTITLGTDLDSNFAFVEVTINGQSGTDALTLNDLADDGSDDYTITTTTFDKSTPGVALFTFGTIESLTLNANTEDNTITVTGTFNGDVRVNGNGGVDTINVVGNFVGTLVTVDGGSGLDNVNVNSDGVGVAAAQFVNSQDLQSIGVFSGGTARLNVGGNKLLSTRTLVIGATGKLDLTDNDMLLDYPLLSQLIPVQNLISAARAAGAWTGFGITSSSAQTNPQHNTTLGAIEATSYDSVNGAGALFNGVDPDLTAVLIKYTYYGDVDFNGVVDFDDYSRIDAGFNNNRTGWFNGDVDYNGIIDFDDYSLIDQAFNTQLGALRPSRGQSGSHDLVRGFASLG